jgi:alpha-mannosidase
MVTVHMIGNSHLDPVWLWRKADGVDAALATARSACDRLDEYPQFVFTCSASWFHQQAERHDAGLFERIRRFVAAGRWQLVGGMVIQPDCNLPASESFAQQLATAQGYFRDRFGRGTTVGYNVDSFGHTAYLPRFLRAGGIDSYVFMRPGPGEKTLPARLFRWRSPDGAEVTTFRLSEPYCANQEDLREHVARSLTDLPAGVEHTMCFYGVGDHGGGPTKEQIEWIRDHAGAGARLIFSHPRAFFDAVAGQAAGLPVVQDELQHHAIGCYSVERRIKVAMRRAEARLTQAAQAASVLAATAPAGTPADIQVAWQGVLFNQFHDILGGTCVYDESLRASGELLAAGSAGDRIVTLLTRRASRGLAEPGTHKIVVFNPADAPFDGWVEHEPWLPFGPEASLVLRDEAGSPVAFQNVEPAALVNLRRMLLRLAVPARQWRVLQAAQAPQPADQHQQAAPAAGAPTAAAQAGKPAGSLDNGLLRAELTVAGLCADGWTIRLDVCDDPTDTWTHCYGRANRFDGPVLGAMRPAGACEVVESGPLRAGLRWKAEFGASRAWCRALLCRGETILRLRLRVVWSEVRRRLRLRLEAPGKLATRVDLVSGGPLPRPIDDLEYPLSGGLLLGSPSDAEELAVAAPEVLSGSVDARGASLTLLRSPYVAHHEPTPPDSRTDQFATDQGTHEFELLICPAWAGGTKALEKLASEMRMPPIVWDVTG